LGGKVEKKHSASQTARNELHEESAQVVDMDGETLEANLPYMDVPNDERGQNAYYRCYLAEIADVLPRFMQGGSDVVLSNRDRVSPALSPVALSPAAAAGTTAPSRLTPETTRMIATTGWRKVEDPDDLTKEPAATAISPPPPAATVSRPEALADALVAKFHRNRKLLKAQPARAVERKYLETDDLARFPLAQFRDAPSTREEFARRGRIFGTHDGRRVQLGSRALKILGHYLKRAPKQKRERLGSASAGIAGEERGGAEQFAYAQ
jgi:hypothetical protein